MVAIVFVTQPVQMILITLCMTSYLKYTFDFINGMSIFCIVATGVTLVFVAPFNYKHCSAVPLIILYAFHKSNLPMIIIWIRKVHDFNIGVIVLHHLCSYHTEGVQAGGIS